MTYIPSIVVVDLETALLSGEPSTEAYKPDFRVVSAAFAWRREDGSVRTVVKSGERPIKRFLTHCQNNNVKLVAHNISFEYLCFVCRFSGFEDMLHYDTARLVQMIDNGGNEMEDYTGELSIDQMLEEVSGNKKKNGLSLVNCASRWLPTEYQDHKTKYHDMIRERGGKRGQEGRWLHLLTKEELHAYNADDAIVTLHLYEKAVSVLGEYDWTFDHDLYRHAAILISKAKIEGVAVDRAVLERHCAEKRRELDTIAISFRNRFEKEIQELEVEMNEKAKMSRKTLKGRENVKPVTFNQGSTKQLQALFCGKLGMKAKFETEKGNPSFNKKFLSQWGEGGEIIKDQKKALVELRQGEALLELSEYDGRWHIDMKAAATATGRFAGGSSE